MGADVKLHCPAPCVWREILLSVPKLRIAFPDEPVQRVEVFPADHEESPVVGTPFDQWSPHWSPSPPRP